jgi:hypothetical protein
MYGLLNQLSRQLWNCGESDTLIDSHPTFVVSADDNMRDDELAELLKLQKDKNAIDDKIARLKSKLGYIPE